ncbi:ty3-gypsy retrotransposon protein, partial [Tanacetum coccineum]
MNRLFSPNLCKFVIVFFDDILVYSTTLTAHLEHSEWVGIEMDPKKIAAVREWPDGFKWGERESEAFERLKQQISTAPVLGLPDFDQPLMIETDALTEGIGMPLVEFLGELKKENRTLEELLDLHQQLDQGNAAAAFRREGRLLIFQDRYFIDADSKLKSLLLREFQNMPSAGHGGVKKMLVGLSALFYWKGMRKSVEDNYGVICEDEAKRRNSGTKMKIFEENSYLLPYAVSSKE